MKKINYCMKKNVDPAVPVVPVATVTNTGERYCYIGNVELIDRFTILKLIIFKICL